MTKAMRVGIGSVTVTATLAAIAFFAAPSGFTISPATVSLNDYSALSSPPTGLQQFTVSTTRNVKWTISPKVGNITQTGLYTAPADIVQGQNIQINAAIRSQVATATVTLVPVVVTVSFSPFPHADQYPPNLDYDVRSYQTIQCSALVNGWLGPAPLPGIVWSVNGIDGGNSLVGTITPSGLYTAPLVGDITRFTVSARITW